MTSHEIGTREEWLKGRLALLEAEKQLTRRSDALARQRQELPWVRIDKDYVFDTDNGEETLEDLFAGRSQLLVYHFMFGPTWKAGCPICTLHAESFDRAIVHLNQRDVTMVAASRGPLAELSAYRERMGLNFRWVSSLRSDFNFDFESLAQARRRSGRSRVQFQHALGPLQRRGARGSQRLRPRGRRRLSHLYMPRARP